MWPLLILIALIAIAAILASVFIWSIISLIVNFVLIYIVALRAYFLFKRKDYYPYLIGFIIGLVVASFTNGLWFLWNITLLFVTAGIIGEAIYWGKKKGLFKRPPRKKP